MRTSWLVLPAVLAASTSGYAAVYLTVDQAQRAIFPGARFSPTDVKLTAEQRRAIEKAGGVRVRSPDVRAWRVAGRGWFIVDEVIGKHDYITYAAGLNADGSVQGIEIMEYRETYGGEIRDERWRRQFAGKTVRDPLKLDADVRNISGATLSCRHVTDGVKRLLALHEIVLAKK